MLKISVVIPAFNSGRFIAEALLSVLAQTYPPSDIIVVDDGSSDDTEHVVRRIMAAGPIAYYRQPNQGPAVARNVGVSKAGGDWIAFLDADDVWYAEKLAVQADAIMTYPQVALFFSEMDYIDEMGRPRPPIDWHNVLTPLMFNHPTPLFPSTVILKKDAFITAGGFNPMLRSHEDAELFIRMGSSSRMHHIDRSLVQYRTHPAQLHRDRERRAESWPILCRFLTEMWKDDPSKLAILRRQAAAVYADLGRYYLRAGEYQAAREFLRQSLGHNPWALNTLRRWGLSYIPGLREWYASRKGKHMAHMTKPRP